MVSFTGSTLATMGHDADTVISEGLAARRTPRPPRDA